MARRVTDLRRGDGRSRCPFGGPGAPANFAFSPDGRWLVFLDPFDTVELWPLGPPQPPLTITVPGLHDLTALSVALA
jgi:hypothetical protein